MPLMLAALASPTIAAEPGTAGVPDAVRALTGCWRGTGTVMGKPVTITLTARPIAEDALLALDGDSQAVADASDRYAMHLVFGGKGEMPGGMSDRISSFWSDSFGGAYVAMGQGETTTDGFTVTYPYPGHAFVNRWRVTDERIAWTIAAKDARDAEKPFADYALRKAACKP